MTGPGESSLSADRIRRWLADLDLFQVARDACRNGFILRRGLQTTDGRGESHYRLAPISDGHKVKAYAGKTVDPWDAAGAFTLFHRLDPNVCLDVRFRMVGSEALAPREIFSVLYMDDFKDACQEKLDVLPQALETDLNNSRFRILEAQRYYRMTAEAACKFTLADASLPYTNLFRFCVAWREGLGYLAQAYATGAAKQYYVAMPAYDHLWGDLLPEVFQQVVTSAYEDALQRSHRFLDRLASQPCPTQNQPPDRRQKKVARDLRQAKGPPEALCDSLARKARELRKDPARQPTGVSFLDRLLPEGQAAGEVYCILGPICGGKTTLAVVLGCTTARRLHAEHLDSHGPSPIIYMAFWEEPAESVRARVLSFTAEVPKDEMEEFRLNRLSTWNDPASYKDYERKRYAWLLDHYGKPLGEKERMWMAISTINCHVKPIDFTGAAAELANSGTEFVSGLAEVIEADQKANGYPGVAMVIADHARAAAVQHCSAKKLDSSKHMHRLLANMPSELKTKIASRYQCPVWVCHQLDIKSNTRSAHVVPKVTDAMGASTFPQDCDACIVLGKMDDSNVLIMANVKCLNSEKPRLQHVQLDGLFATFRVVSGRVAIDDPNDPPEKLPQKQPRRGLARRNPSAAKGEGDVIFDF